MSYTLEDFQLNLRVDKRTNMQIVKKVGEDTMNVIWFKGVCNYIHKALS